MLRTRYMSRTMLAVVATALLAVPAASSDPGAMQRALENLHPKHPRLLAREQDWGSVRRAIVNDPLVRTWHERLQAEASKMLPARPIEHKLIGPRLLDKSRTALHRISTLAGLYRLGGDRALAERAILEMRTAAGFPDWNPAHFLDTAEMTAALALGYDWLYEILSPEDRTIIRTAIVEKGLKPGLRVYRKGGGWPVVTHNWNQVCNGGLALGALALADEEPALAGEIMNHAQTSIVRAMSSFAPDGGWAEGPGYWSYATRYNVLYLAALESALGTDLGLKRIPGFDCTGDFRIHSIGPLGRTFNFADAHEGAGTAAQMLWLARAFNRPDYAEHERSVAHDRPEMLHLLWATANDSAKAPLPPLDRFFRGIDVAFFRSGWNDRQALFVGFHGGNNRANHSHLDLGSFVLDALGERWAADLGPDDYNLPGYFGKQRWTYYRLRTEGHNTLAIDGQNQVSTARAPVVAYRSTPEQAYAVVDLTAAYAPKVKQARRGLAVLHRKQVLIQDEIQAEQPVDIAWNLHTRAAIDIQGNRALLTQGKVQMEARILAPSDARFVVVSANPPPPQAQQPNISNLTIRLPGAVRETRLAVLLTPVGTAINGPELESLATWIASGKLAR